MDVSIIIVNYKTPELLKDCIVSVIEKTININYEIIVVDNNSNDGSEEIISNYFPNVHYIQSGSNLGFGKANNLGLKKALGRNVFFLNSDTLLMNNAINILSEYLDNHDKVGLCGGNLFDLKSNYIHSFSPYFPGIYNELDAILSFRLSKILNRDRKQFNPTNKTLKVAYICGADMMVKKTVLEKVGGFDPDFFLYFEETELCHRISKESFEIHSVPDAKIIHLEGGSQSTSKAKLTFYNKSRKLYYKKRYSRFNYVFVSVLFYVKCFVALTKNLIFFNKNKINLWYNNLTTY